MKIKIIIKKKKSHLAIGELIPKLTLLKQSKAKTFAGFDDLK